MHCIGLFVLLRYIIKPQRKCTLARDEIQPEGLMIYTTLRAVMIYQACGLDKKEVTFGRQKLLFFAKELLNGA